MSKSCEPTKEDALLAERVVQAWKTGGEGADMSRAYQLVAMWRMDIEKKCSDKRAFDMYDMEVMCDRCDYADDGCSEDPPMLCKGFMTTEYIKEAIK